MPSYFMIKMTGVPAQLGVTATVLHTVATNRRDRIDALTLHNATGVARVVEVYLVPSGGGAGVTNRVMKDTIPADKQRVVHEALGMVLSAGDTVVAIADAAAAVTASGAVLASTT